MLAESKFNSIKTLMLQTLGDLDITHEELTMILKENLVSENEDEQQETIKLSKKKKNKNNKYYKIFSFFSLYINNV